MARITSYALVLSAALLLLLAGGAAAQGPISNFDDLTVSVSATNVITVTGSLFYTSGNANVDPAPADSRIIQCDDGDNIGMASLVQMSPSTSRNSFTVVLPKPAMGTENFVVCSVMPGAGFGDTSIEVSDPAPYNAVGSNATDAPTAAPTAAPTHKPTKKSTNKPTRKPTRKPTKKRPTKKRPTKRRPTKKRPTKRRPTKRRPTRG